MTDRHNEAARVAAVLAAQGLSARVVTQQDTYGVEVILEDDRAIWTLNESGWSYVVLSQVEGGLRITSSGFAEVGIYDEPERVAFVIANFPYDHEMTEEEAREAVAGLISQVYDMTDEEREALLSQTFESEVEFQTMSWSALADSGVLWAINRHLFNPSGLSLVLRYEDKRAVGWAILGDAASPVQMDRLADLDGYRKFGAFMDGLVASAE
jgi:hypothetical protein